MKFGVKSLSILLLSALSLVGLRATGQTLDEAFALRHSNPDSTIIIAQQVISRWDGDWKELARANHLIGLGYWLKGEHNSALKFYNEAKDIRIKLGDSLGLANTYNNMGLVFWKMQMPEEAMAHYHRSLEMNERLGDTIMMARTLGNIGILLEEQGDLNRALEFHLRSLELADMPGNEGTKSNAFNNIGIIYRQLKDFDKAIFYLTQALEYYTEVNDFYGQALVKGNIGLVYNNKKYYSVADRYFRESLDIYTAMDDQTGMAMNLGNLADNCLSEGNIKEAYQLGRKALEMGRAIKHLQYEMTARRVLAICAAKLGKSDEAADNMERYMNLSDSLRRSEASGQVTILQQQFEFQRDREKMEGEREAERALAEAKLSRQVLIRNGIFGLGLLALVFLGLQYRNFKRERKSKELLALKNEEISRQKQEITDSIIYAKRLQDARLPGSATLNRLFGDCRVFYRPKDIVSGDFYWAEESGGISFLAVADCTGHGVPGAMVSMVATEGLNEAVLKQHLSDPAKILHYLNNHIQTAFHTQSSEVRDGLDIALISFNPKEKRIQFAGANSSVFVVSEKETMDGAALKISVEGKYLHEIKGDRTGIGGRDASVHFTLKTWTAEPGQILLFSSDGYADQFGGPHGKKLGSKRSREIWLEALSSGDFSRIEREFDRWKGREEQVDDVTVVRLEL
jgi:tetratricopeptide (TPR) repeat protein